MNAKLKGVLILSGVFTLGAVAGAGVSWAWLQREVANELGGKVERRFERRHLRALARELDLSEAQRSKISKIMASHREEREQLMRTLADECGDGLREHREKVAEEIRGVLDPEQQQQFDNLRQKQLERFPLMGPRRGGHKGRSGQGRHSRRPQGEGQSSADPARTFSRFDKNGDDKLSEDEVPPRAWRRMLRADADQDGVISQDELTKHRARRRQRGGRTRGGRKGKGPAAGEPR